MEAEIRKLSRRREGNDSDDEPTKKKKGEEDVLGMLNSFRGKLKNSKFADGPEEDAKMEGEADAVEGKMDVGGEDPGIEVDDDRGFLSHSLRFPKDDGEESRQRGIMRSLIQEKGGRKREKKKGRGRRQ